MKRHIVLAVTALVVVALLGAAVYEYQQNQKPDPAVTRAQAAEHQLSIVRQVSAKNQADLTAQLTQLNAQKANVCTQLKSLRQANPVCQ